ncbi:MAG TPA: RidA family protein [Actinomycetota bacterium]|nr:RidA family protein [Actinomycetota bacterium]
MKPTPEQRLVELGITLPEPPGAVAAYVPTVVHNGQIWVSGQVPLRDGGLPRVGLVGRDISVEDAAEEARFCALNALAHLKAAAGSLNEIERILKLTVFVASSAGFHAQPLVANGASDLFQEVFGDQGRHARSAVGVAELPLGAPVEIEVIAALRG